MSAAFNTEASPNLSPEGARGGDINMSNISNSSSTNTTALQVGAPGGFDINEHDYDGLLKGSSSTSTAAEGTMTSFDNNTGGLLEVANNNHMDASQGGGIGPASGASSSTRTAPSPPVAVSSSKAAAAPSVSIGQDAAANVPASGPGLVRMTTLTGSSGVSEVKLRRFLEHNQRLREQLELQRASVSEASHSLMQYIMTTKDPFLPMIWGSPGSDPFAKQSSGCCTIC